MIGNANLIFKHVIQIKNRIRNYVNANVKIIAHTKKIIVGILAHVFVKMVSILKSILDTSEIACDEITSVMDIVPTKMTNTIATICQ